MKTYFSKRWIAIGLLLGLWSGLAMAAVLPAKQKNASPSKWDAAKKQMAALGHFQGPSVPGVDCSTLTGKVVVGYQGWQNAQGDGANNGWRHYEFGGSFKPGHTCIDYWPDVSEFDADEKYPTPFRKKDGSTAYVFSAFNPKSVDRHFQWMQQYGIDAAFLQRFASSVTRDPGTFNHCNVVLRNVRAAANAHGRGWVVMYDLSGLRADGLEALKQDWRMLVDQMGVTRDAADKAYLHHHGKPLVAVWGIGMADDPRNPGKRAFNFSQQAKFIDFLKHDTIYGDNSVMIGVPNSWRSQTKDSISDPAFLEMIRTNVDVVSPWTVSRYKTVDGVEPQAEKFWKPDLAWCKAAKVDYLPVVFPGFSWHNKNSGAKMDAIPRLGGEFLWKQYAELKKLGATMVYQAMFDEIDEGTQIYKVDNNPPVGASQFLTYPGLPSDHYLWLVGQSGRLLRGEIPLNPELYKQTDPKTRDNVVPGKPAKVGGTKTAATLQRANVP